MKNDVAIISVIYHESTWFTTANCIARCNAPTFFADRGGVHGLSAAFNQVMRQHQLADRFEYVWCLTDVSFADHVLPTLLAAIKEDTTFAAITPAFHSDHRHTRPNGCNEVREVPFVEFTAPLVRAQVLADLPLDEQMPYDGHDMDWGLRVRQTGLKLGVHHGVTVDHIYLRHIRSRNPATKTRSQLRQHATQPTFKRLEEKHGNNWKQLVGFGG